MGRLSGQPVNGGNPSSSRFRRAEHLRLPGEFRKVYERRRSASDVWLIVYACENNLPYLRLGLSVSRKVGQATYRNRVRRLYKEAFRLTRHEMPVGLDLVLIPRSSREPSLSELKESLPRLVGQLARKLGRGRGPIMIRAMLAFPGRALSFLLILAVRFYQVCLGPLLPPVCRFRPSCSQYFILAVQKHGPVCGAWKGARRICRCHPWNPGGYDPP